LLISGLLDSRIVIGKKELEKIVLILYKKEEAVRREL
jgi:hypothetical protein